MASQAGPEGASGLNPRLLAFYLPQFHPTPENDVGWGKGHTEWTGVVRARPLFPGHYQPRIPADLGFYDLRLPEVRQAQADLAREHGIHGFAYHHYWSNGRRILERPFDEMLESGHPDFPFCVCWANHNWSWRGGDRNRGRILHQEYDEKDDRAHIRWLLGVFEDERYIRVGGRPLLISYWAHAMPDPKRTFEMWREESAKAGEAEPYIVKVESFQNYEDPASFGCDAAVEFWPHGIDQVANRVLGEDFYKRRFVYEYEELVLGHLRRPAPPFKRFPCVVPHWDNTPRLIEDVAQIIIRNSTPELYEHWTKGVIEKTANAFPPEEQLVFVNAWNEWGEGTYLEPDIKYGRAYLEATRRALLSSGVEVPTGAKAEDIPPPASTEKLYENLLRKHEDLQRRLMEQLSTEERSPLAQTLNRNLQKLERENTSLKRQREALQSHSENLQTQNNALQTKLTAPNGADALLSKARKMNARLSASPAAPLWKRMKRLLRKLLKL